MGHSRNIFQSDALVAIIQAVEGVVHGGLTSEQGFEKYNDHGRTPKPLKSAKSVANRIKSDAHFA